MRDLQNFKDPRCCAARARANALEARADGLQGATSARYFDALSIHLDAYADLLAARRSDRDHAAFIRQEAANAHLCLGALLAAGATPGMIREARERVAGLEAAAQALDGLESGALTLADVRPPVIPED